MPIFNGILNKVSGLLTRGTAQTSAQDARHAGLAQGEWFWGGPGAPLPSTFEAYRTMRKNPTVALARAAATAPLLATTPAYEVTRDDVPDTHVKFVQKTIDKLFKRFMRNAVFTLDYGFKPLEIVYSLESGTDFGLGQTLIGIKQLKPLSVDKTRVSKRDQEGNAIEYENYGRALSPEYVAWLKYDAEDDNDFGRSRMENIRETSYFGWCEAFKKQMQYFSKVAGVIPLIQFPPGVEKDKQGVERSTFELAEKILERLGKGHGVIMPNTLAVAAQDLIDRGASLEMMQAWSIKFLESAGSHAGTFDTALRHHESGIVRGWVLPERTITEGQMGTKAESESQSDWALLILQMTLDDIIEQLNELVIDKLLMFNFGPEAIGSIICKPAPIVDAQRLLIKQIIVSALATRSDLIEMWLDVDAMLDQLGLPKIAEIVPMTSDKPEPPPPDDGSTSDDGGDEGDGSESDAGLAPEDNDRGAAQLARTLMRAAVKGYSTRGR